MSHPSLTVKRTALVGVILVSTALGANAATVSRCNALLDGVYRPVLLVEVNGETHVHSLGDGGLTRGIVFDPNAALDWAKARYGAAEAWSTRATCDTEGDWRSVGAGDEDEADRGGYLVR